MLSAACCPRYAPLIPSTTKLFDRAKEESEKSSDHNRGRDDSRVTVGMTTCKRLHLFLRTMSLLLNHIGDFPNKFVKEVQKSDYSLPFGGLFKSSHDHLYLGHSYR